MRGTSIQNPAIKVGIESDGSNLRLKYGKVGTEGFQGFSAPIKKADVAVLEGITFGIFVTDAGFCRVSREILRRDLSFRAISALVGRFPVLASL